MIVTRTYTAFVYICVGCGATVEGTLNGRLEAPVEVIPEYSADGRYRPRAEHWSLRDGDVRCWRCILEAAEKQRERDQVPPA